MTLIKSTPLSPALFKYLESHTLVAHPILDRVASETALLPDAIMQIPRHQGGFMHLLVRLLGVKCAIEVGCYTGYSAIAVGSALPADGELTAFDVDPVASRAARQYFEEAGLAGRIQLIVGDARETLSDFVRARGSGFADFAFVDADKVHYDVYYERCLEALRPGGLMLLDNAFRDGGVLTPEAADAGTLAIIELTRKIQSDSRVDATMLPVADGLIMVRKRMN